MTGIFIAYNQAYYEEVIELLEQHHSKGFTRWNEISGRGSRGGEPHLGSHTWPTFNDAILTFVEDEFVDEIMNAPINGSGCNEAYGLLGSNKATEETVKLFPRNCQPVVDAIQAKLKEATGKTIEVMVYGDGAFKDPVGKIWELADPVVAPAYTSGLEGTPNELKLKYLADNDFASLSGDALKEAIKNKISEKDDNLVGKMASEGTTPRRLTDLIGSLCDLTSGSGDKGTPIVFIQGYFDNYTAE